MKLANLHVPSSLLSPLDFNTLVEPLNHSRAKACKQQQQQRHALRRFYETETGSKSCKLTLRRQQVPLDGSTIVETEFKNSDTRRDRNKRCAKVRCLDKQPVTVTCSTNLTTIQPNHNLPLKQGSSSLKDSHSKLYQYESLKTPVGLCLTPNHITQVSYSHSHSHPLQQTKYKNKYHTSVREDNIPKIGLKPLFAISLSGLIVFLILFQHSVSLAKSVKENSENNLSNNPSKPLEHEVILTATTTTTPDPIIVQTKAPIETKTTTLGELFSKISGAFKKSIAQTTTTTTTTTSTTQSQPTTTTAEPETTTHEEDESSSGRDDDDAESCSGLSVDESAETKNLTDNERLVNLQNCFQRKVKKSISKATRQGLEAFEKLSLSGGCSSSLMNLLASLAEIKSFAFKFLDASAKIPSGVLVGLLSDFGDFDECLALKSNPSIPVEEEENEVGAFSGKYCLVSAKLNYHVNLTNSSDIPEGIIPDGIFWDELLKNYWTTKSAKGFQFGMCFPSRCTDDDLDQLYQYIAKSYNADGKLIGCQDGLTLKQQHTRDLTQQLIIYAFRGLIGLTIVATILDRYYPRLVANESHQKCSLELLNQLNGESSIDSVRTNFDCIDKLAFTLKIITCFSIIKSWNLFTRNDQKGNNQWDCPSEFNSSPASTNRNSQIANESSDSERTSFDKKDTESPIESTTNIFRNQILVDHHNHQQQSHNQDIDTINSDKLCQLIIRIQPNNDPKLTSGGRPLRHLSGLKLFVLIWITIGHSFLYPSANNYQYYRSIINMNVSKYSIWFATTSYTLGIDMLLYMTGLSFVYKLARLNSNSRYMNDGYSVGFKVNSKGLMRLISKKVLRFWPTYLTLITLAIVIPTLSDGPMWPEMVSKRIGDSCRKNWWSNLLFINNVFKETEICLPSSWFVSVLMQLFLIGSIIIVITSKISIRVGLIVISSLLATSCAISFAFAYIKEVRAPIVRLDESFVMELDENIFKLYTNIFNNLGPFLVGMIGGFLLMNSQIRELNEKDKRKRSHDTTILGSITSKINFSFILVSLITITIAIAVLSTVFYQEYPLFWSSTYWSLHRVGWAIFTGYIIHNCATGRFQLLNDFLSLSTFIPFSRLIPIAYLVYPLIIYIHVGSVRDGLHVSIYNMLNIYITRLSMTFIVAFFIHILVEIPLCSVEEIYLNRWVKKIRISEDKSKKLHPLLDVAPVIATESSENL